MKKIKQIFQLILDIDKKVLDFLELLCHKQQRFFGVTHYFWLKIDALFFAALYGSIIYPTVPAEEKWKLILLILILLVFGSIGFDIWEKKSYQRIANGLANPLRKNGILIYFRWTHFYLVAPLMFLSGIILFVYEFSLVTIVVALLFIAFLLLYVLPACDPLPPTKGKLRPMIQNLFGHKTLGST